MTKTIEVKGMSCNHCVQSVTKALSGVDGVTGVNVDLLGAKATFQETKPVAESALKDAIEKAGFEPGRVS